MQSGWYAEEAIDGSLAEVDIDAGMDVKPSAEELRHVLNRNTASEEVQKSGNESTINYSISNAPALPFRVKEEPMLEESESTTKNVNF